MAFDLQQKVFRIPSNIAVSVGLRWDFIGADPVDLDLSAVCFTSEGMFLDCVFFNHPFPSGTDEAALRSAGVLVDPRQLPFMFVSGDSRVGGEEENRLPGLALAARRREFQLRHNTRAGAGGGELARLGVTEALFSRLYEEEELEGVEAALDEERGGGEVFDEEGRPLRPHQRREFCDESVTFVMHKLPSEAEVIFLVVTSYTGADFTTLPGVKLVVVNETTNERVGSIELKRATGNGTANLACMLCRLPCVTADPAEPQQWDLRELNIRTFGYTFVDVLPVMMDVLGVDANSRDDALRLLPDYPLTKEISQNMGQPLSDVRFGVGWYGEHDLDAFMLMLDENNSYIDHIHPKQSKLQSVFPHAARHSGDAINGFGTTGDEEFIDFVTYRMPPEVHTILFGVTYVESFGSSAKCTKSIFDIPKLYLRMQNRSVERPNAFEVDRWNIHYEVEEELEKKKKVNGKTQQSRTPRMYLGPDGKKYPVRMVVLGLMVKKGEVSFNALYPTGQLGQEKILQENEEQDESKTSEDIVSLFEYCPLHEYIPVSIADNFSAVMPYLYCVARYRSGAAISTNNNNNNNNILIQGARTPQILNTENNFVGWQMSPFPTSTPSPWEEMKSTGTMLTRYAVQVQFLEIRNLQPTLPHRFKCHGEAWVCDAVPSVKRALNIYDMPPFRTPYLIHRDSTQWDEKSPATAALFFVRKFDRIRVVIYEYAAFGYVDIDLMDIGELWQAEKQSSSSSTNTGNERFNSVEKWFPLKGNELTDGDLKLRLSRVPTKTALRARENIIAEANKARRRYARQVAERREDSIRKRYSNPCSVM